MLVDGNLDSNCGSSLLDLYNSLALKTLDEYLKANPDRDWGVYEEEDSYFFKEKMVMAYKEILHRKIIEHFGRDPLVVQKYTMAYGTELNCTYLQTNRDKLVHNLKKEGYPVRTKHPKARK